jgi:hypothetical protein
MLSGFPVSYGFPLCSRFLISVAKSFSHLTSLTGFLEALNIYLLYQIGLRKPRLRNPEGCPQSSSLAKSIIRKNGLIGIHSVEVAT